MITTRGLPSLAMIGACLLWSSAVVGTKLGVEQIDVAPFIVARLALGAAGLWLMVLATRADARLARVGWRPFAMGALEPGLVSLLVTVGLTMSSPVNSAV